MAEAISCKNCGNSFTGKFCNACGEKFYDEKDKKLKHFFEEVFHFLTHLDGKFLTTLKAIFLQPGKLSSEYCDGMRKKYFKPVSFFLVCIILYLLFPKFQGLNMHFSTYVNKDYMYAIYATPMAKKKIQKLGISGNQLAQKYDAVSPRFAKPFLLMILPLSALTLWALHFRRRRFFFDHFIMATELTTFIFSFGFLILPLIMVITTSLFPSTTYFFQDSGPLWPISWLVMLCIAFIALKRFYRQNWWVTLIKSGLFVFIYIFIIQDIYKMLLYLTIMLFI